ncbi:MAG: hypothetical protein N4A76_14640 [Firmicutes bacterium]|jgi:hypothetical protein|nr:hypothetical protein [Bacillota bacterium]
MNAAVVANVLTGIGTLVLAYLIKFGGMNNLVNYAGSGDAQNNKKYVNWIAVHFAIISIFCFVYSYLFYLDRDSNVYKLSYIGILFLLIFSMTSIGKLRLRK